MIILRIIIQWFGIQCMWEFGDFIPDWLHLKGATNLIFIIILLANYGTNNQDIVKWKLINAEWLQYVFGYRFCLSNCLGEKIYIFIMYEK